MQIRYTEIEVVALGLLAYFGFLFVSRTKLKQGQGNLYSARYSDVVTLTNGRTIVCMVLENNPHFPLKVELNGEILLFPQAKVKSVTKLTLVRNR